MKIFGLPIPFTGERKAALNLNGVTERSSAWFRILESFTGAWQHNVEIDRDLVVTYSAVYACLTLIASDIAKLRIKLVKKTAAGIWEETSNPAYSPVLRKPNPFQTRIQFIENWVLSKLISGNTYVLKRRDNRGVVNAMYILDPRRVTPKVADDGSVYYQLNTDNIASVTEDILVPASEIIHDRMNCIYHPLVGTSPILACGLAATQGMNIQKGSSYFFGNKSIPGGILTAPGAISDATAARLKETWQTGYTGENAGKVAVLGDGLKYEGMQMSAEESQLIEQLKWTSETVCSTFHVPGYKVGVGQMPAYSNVQSLNVEYFSQCLQVHIEAIELCLDEGLATGDALGTEFDVANLLRMDSVTQMEVLDKGKNIMTPNEQRKALEFPPVKGGNTVYRQQQDYSLEALSRRDAQDDPFNPPKAEPAPQAADPANDNAMELEAAKALIALQKGLLNVRR